MPNQYDLTGQNIENTYQRVLQTPDGVNIFDGTGSLFHLGVFNNTSTGSYGSFYDTGSQTAILNTVIYSMSLSTTDISNGVYIGGSDRTQIYFTNAGVYNVQFSAQFSNTGNNPDDVNIWIRKNDVGSINDIPDSSGVCTIPAKKGAVPGQLIASWNYYITAAANDFIQLCWAATTSNTITLETIAAGTNPVHPRTPSLILTAQRIDTFLSNTGSFSGSFIGTHTGSFTGSFTGSLLGTASWANSASQALTASFIQIAQTASFVTGSVFTLTNPALSASYALTASYVENLPNIDTSSLVTTSSFNAFTSSINTFTASYNTGSFSGSFTGSFNGTASWADSASQAVSASYVLSSSYSLSSSYALSSSYSVSSSYALSSSYSLSSSLASTSSFYQEIDPIFTAKSASLATTGSNAFINNQTISGSLIVTGSISSLNTTASQETFSSATYISGDIIQGTVVGVNQYELAYLNTNGTWQHIDQTTISSTKMLGIYIGGDKILIDGNISATTAGVGSPIGVNIMNPDQGLPVYIDSGSAWDFNTTIPTSDYIRTLGYIYYNNTINTDNWILKFRPSTDWYKI